jgi:hypothetical protein
MKKFLPVVVLLASIGSAQVASAAVDASREAQMKECFQAHAKLMEKPGLRNLASCWLAHSYLMGR